MKVEGVVTGEHSLRVASWACKGGVLVCLYMLVTMTVAPWAKREWPWLERRQPVTVYKHYSHKTLTIADYNAANAAAETVWVQTYRTNAWPR
jgi:hypothetical protein